MSGYGSQREVNAIRWSDHPDSEAGNATVREAIDASPHRDAFLAVVAKFAAKASRHETVNVHWWSYPRIYIEVTDARHGYPYNGRALVSFDLTNGKFASWDSEHRYVFARRGWIGFLTELLGYAPPVYDEEQPEAPDGQVSLTGRPQVFASFDRYRLSNGWFIDRATRAPGNYGGYKYALFEPGGGPSGCAGLRGGAPTLALALAVANGETPCGLASHGCRKLATGYRPVTIHGREGRAYYCENHAPAPEVTNRPVRKVATTVLVAVTERHPLALSDH